MRKVKVHRPSSPAGKSFQRTFCGIYGDDAGNFIVRDTSHQRVPVSSPVTLSDNPGGSAHSLYGLVKVLVQRVTTVGGYHDFIRSNHLLHRGLANEFAPFPVRPKQVARENPRDFAEFIQGDIDEKAFSNQQRQVAHLFPSDSRRARQKTLAGCSSSRRYDFVEPSVDPLPQA